MNSPIFSPHTAWNCYPNKTIYILQYPTIYIQPKHLCHVKGESQNRIFSIGTVFRIGFPMRSEATGKEEAHR